MVDRQEQIRASKQPSELACPGQDWQDSPGLAWPGALGQARQHSQRDVTPHLLCRPAASAPPLFPEEPGTEQAITDLHTAGNLLPHYVPRSALSMSNGVVKSETGNFAFKAGEQF